MESGRTAKAESFCLQTAYLAVTFTDICNKISSSDKPMGQDNLNVLKLVLL